MTVVTRFAPAKVNLFLHVTGRRPDGYHELDSVAVFPAVGDVVRVRAAEGLSLELAGPFAGALAGETDNLLLRAARALRPGGAAALELQKNLPVASGIGGGSADAAAALAALAELWGVAGVDLHGIAAGLGADVPVCLASRPARMRGIGEVLQAAPVLPAFGMVLVNPGVAVPTPAVFRARSGGFSEAADLPGVWPDVAAMIRDLQRTRNDLQAAAIGIAPVIAEVLDVLASLPGALLARMSGSGATCFALFADTVAAQVAAGKLAERSGWWCWGGGLYAPGSSAL